MDGSLVATLARHVWVAGLTLVLLGIAAYWLRPKDSADLKKHRGIEPEE